VRQVGDCGRLGSILGLFYPLPLKKGNAVAAAQTVSSVRYGGDEFILHTNKAN
jgi:hypothetical protein